MAHRDLHITRDHDAAEVTAAREVHSMSTSAGINAAGGLRIEPARAVVEMVPVPVAGNLPKPKSKPR